jgi:hypothetical protein
MAQPKAFDRKIVHGSGHIFGRVVVKFDVPDPEFVGGNYVDHPTSMQLVEYAVKCISGAVAAIAA